MTEYIEKTNIFDNPQCVRNLILENPNIVIKNNLDFSGKSLICVFFTSYCGVGCPFCFFNSPNPEKTDDIERYFNKEGLEKFITFANQANLGYLQISGGWEPFLEKEAILEGIKRIKVDRIILVTSGIWAYSEEKAKEYVRELDSALNAREIKTRLSIRLSVSHDHSLKLKEKPLVNLLRKFKKNYANRKDFTLQLKCFDDDNTLFKQLDDNFGHYKIQSLGKNQSDDEGIVKIMPKKFTISFQDGFSVIVGQSRVFEPSLRPNLYDYNSIKRTINVYNKDLQQSQRYFPSIVYDSHGNKGIDWIVEYNGNVCGWQNRVQDNLLNIYEDDYNEVLEKSLGDPLTLSFFEKGSQYREKIISEISKRTVALMKAVSIRDYAGTLLFEDEKIRLYYTIRVLQDYFKENRINLSVLNKLPETLQEIIKGNINELKKMYKKSKYSVLEQELAKPHNSVEFRDFMELVKLGHFELNKKKVSEAIAHYNLLESQNKISTLDDITHEVGLSTERRLTKRVMTIKKLHRMEVNEKNIYIFRHGETEWNVENRIKGQLENLDSGFTEKGRKQIESLADELKNLNIEIIYSSDLQRTKETAILANKLIRKKVSFHKELRGFNMGKYQGLLFKDFIKDPNVQAAFHNYDIPIPGGESINQLNKRLLSFILDICEHSEFKNIAIVTHSAAMSNLCSYISGEPYRDIESCHLFYSKEGQLNVINSKEIKKKEFDLSKNNN